MAGSAVIGDDVVGGAVDGEVGHRLRGAVIEDRLVVGRPHRGDRLELLRHLAAQGRGEAPAVGESRRVVPVLVHQVLLAHLGHHCAHVVQILVQAGLRIRGRRPGSLDALAVDDQGRGVVEARVVAQHRRVLPQSVEGEDHRPRLAVGVAFRDGQAETSVALPDPDLDGGGLSGGDRRVGRGGRGGGCACGGQNGGRSLLRPALHRRQRLRVLVLVLRGLRSAAARRGQQQSRSDKRQRPGAQWGGFHQRLTPPVPADRGSRPPRAGCTDHRCAAAHRGGRIPRCGPRPSPGRGWPSPPGPGGARPPARCGRG